MKGRLGLFAASVSFARAQQTAQFAEKALAATFGLHVRHRAGKEDFRFAFENVKRRRAEFAFAADNFARIEMPLHHGLLIQFQKSSGDILKNRQVQQFRGIEHITRAQFRADDPLIGERAR